MSAQSVAPVLHPNRHIPLHAHAVADLAPVLDHALSLFRRLDSSLFLQTFRGSHATRGTGVAGNVHCFCTRERSDLKLSLPLQEGCRLLAYNNARCHGVPGRYTRQNGSICNTESLHSVDFQFAIDHRHLIGTHLCRTALMPECAKPVAKETL